MRKNTAGADGDTVRSGRVVHFVIAACFRVHVSIEAGASVTPVHPASMSFGSIMETDLMHSRSGFHSPRPPIRQQTLACNVLAQHMKFSFY